MAEGEIDPAAPTNREERRALEKRNRRKKPLGKARDEVFREDHVAPELLRTSALVDAKLGGFGR